MNKSIFYTLLAVCILLLINLSGYTQVNKRYNYLHDASGNRNSRIHELITLQIPLMKGYNLISTNVLPENKDMLQVLQTLINNGTLILAYNESNQTVENLGNGWTNAIGDIQATEGYKVQVGSNCTLSISGDQIALPLTINLATGWNIISFPHTIEVNGMQVMQPLIDNGTLIKVQDEAGNSLENWGVFGGWRSGIGNFRPGKGYKVRVNADTQLTINESYSKSAAFLLAKGKTEHFSPSFIGNGIDHMNLNIVSYPIGLIETGDEISAYDGEICVGAVKITEQNLKENIVQLNVSSKEANGKNGFTKGNKVELKLWEKASNKEYRLITETVKGTYKFEKQESCFIRLIGLEKEKSETNQNENSLASKTEESLPALDKQSESLLKSMTLINQGSESIETMLKCYPNPMTDDVTIEFYSSTSTHINISIYNSAGLLIRTITDGDVTLGNKRYNWDRTDGSGRKVTAGLYLCKLMVDNHYYNTKLIVR